MKRELYYKLLLVTYIIVGLVWTKQFTLMYGYETYLAETWYKIANFVLLGSGAVMVFLNAFLIGIRYGSSEVSASANKKSGEEISSAECRIELYVEGGMKTYWSILLLPLLLAGLSLIQWGEMFDGLAALSLFLGWYLYNACTKEGKNDYLIQAAKAGTTIE